MRWLCYMTYTLHTYTADEYDNECLFSGLIDYFQLLHVGLDQLESE